MLIITCTANAILHSQRVGHPAGILGYGYKRPARQRRAHRRFGAIRRRHNGCELVLMARGLQRYAYFLLAREEIGEVLRHGRVDVLQPDAENSCDWHRQDHPDDAPECRP
eukprot:scaffold14476_cov120-Isochrysis_galbana.AAC.10